MTLKALPLVAACLTVVWGAHAQPVSTPAVAAASAPATPASASKPPVRVSTDPARAAQVLKAAAEMKKRPAPSSVGLARAQTPDGFKLLSGGVTVEDQQTMQKERADYSLWVATVAKPSGAYLADVNLRIERAGAKTTASKSPKTDAVVVERRMEGPWLLLALPPGTYQVTGSFRDTEAAAVQTLNQRISVPAKGQRQVVLRFVSTAEVEADAPGRVANPFGTAQGPGSTTPQRP